MTTKLIYRKVKSSSFSNKSLLLKIEMQFGAWAAKFVYTEEFTPLCLEKYFTTIYWLNTKMKAQRIT